jgi:GT2 family glycosyltransferase
VAGEGSRDDGACREALQRALRRRGSAGKVVAAGPGLRRTVDDVKGAPLVSLIVPTRDQGGLLRNLLESVDARSSYRRFEVVVVDNGSTEPATLRYLADLELRWRVLRDPRPFNWAALNNAAARKATGEFLVFLNNDVEVVAPGWLEAMLGAAQRPEVGAVGARLLYPDRTIQHAGVIVGLGGIAGHAFKHVPWDATEPLGGPAVPRNWSAVTGACMMVRREVFGALGRFDERLGVAYNDVDFCLRARARGYLVVYTPWATLLHFESATRWRIDPRRNRALFRRCWRDVIRAGDPYYNPNLSLERGDWQVE